MNQRALLTIVLDKEDLSFYANSDDPLELHMYEVAKLQPALYVNNPDDWQQNHEISTRIWKTILRLNKEDSVVDALDMQSYRDNIFKIDPRLWVEYEKKSKRRNVPMECTLFQSCIHDYHMLQRYNCETPLLLPDRTKFYLRGMDLWFQCRNFALTEDTSALEKVVELYTEELEEHKTKVVSQNCESLASFNYSRLETEREISSAKELELLYAFFTSIRKMFCRGQIKWLNLEELINDSGMALKALQQSRKWIRDNATASDFTQDDAIRHYVREHTKQYSQSKIIRDASMGTFRGLIMDLCLAPILGSGGGIGAEKEIVKMYMEIALQSFLRKIPDNILNRIKQTQLSMPTKNKHAAIIAQNQNYFSSFLDIGANNQDLIYRNEKRLHKEKVFS